STGQALRGSMGEMQATSLANARARFFVLAVLASAVAPASLDAQPAKPFPPLDVSVRQAWERAGAQVTWLALSDRGFPHHTDKSPGEGQAWPCLRVEEWKPGMAAGLPAPPTPFAMSLLDLGRDGEALRELGPLMQLQALHLAGVELSDADWKELAKLI